MNPDIETILDMGRLALQFGRTNRATFHEDGRTPESDTDHTVMLGLIACTYAATGDYEGVDPGDVAMFCLVHDLVEARCGDTNSFGITPDARAEREKRERKAFLDLCEEFGSSSWMMAALHLYEGQNHPAARFVRYLDKAMPKITHILNGCTAIKGMGHDRKVLHATHQAQLNRLSEEYPEFRGTPVEAAMRQLMYRSEIEMSYPSQCGKCGSEIPAPGPCPTCDDQPYGKLRFGHHPDCVPGDCICGRE